MSDEKFLLVSLEEDHAKSIAAVLSNQTSRRILNYLSDTKSSTESEMAKELGIALSTVHYNIRLLEKAGFVVASEYHYSSKGNEVNHWSVASKYIVIAPKKTHRMKNMLKKVLFSTAGALGVGLFLNSFMDSFFSSGGPEPKMVALGSDVASSQVAKIAAESATDLSAENVANTTAGAVSHVIHDNFWIWYCVGILVFVCVYILADHFIEKRQSSCKF